MSTQLIVRDPLGNIQSVLSNFSRLEYMRSLNKTGWLQIDFDPARVDTKLFRLDTRIEPWRTVGATAPYLDGETVYFVRKLGYRIDRSGREVFTVRCLDANMIVDGAIVAYASDTAQASKTDNCDDMMKAIVRENLGASSTDTTRSLAAYMTVQADLSLCASITKEFSRRNVGEILRDLANDSFVENGVTLAYDVVYTSPTMLEFRTYANRRGVDHSRTSAQPVIISRERRNLEEPELIEDHETEYTYVYAGGQGIGSARVVKTASAAPSILSASPFSRRELWVDARNTSTDAAVQSEANVALQYGRYKMSLTGTIVDVEGCLDGVQYRWGDVVYSEYRGIGFDNAHLSAMHATIENGRETRENFLRASI